MNIIRINGVGECNCAKRIFEGKCQRIALNIVLNSRVDYDILKKLVEKYTNYVIISNNMGVYLGFRLNNAGPSDTGFCLHF